MSKLCVAIDGSTYGIAAFELACALRKPEDSISIYHIAAVPSAYSEDENSISPQTIAQDMHRRARHLPPSKFMMTIRRKTSYDQKTHIVISQVANTCQAKLLFLGYYGRKNQEEEEESKDQIGANVLHCLKNIKCTSFIIKNNHHLPSHRPALRFICGFDGSRGALVALQRVLEIIHESDSLLVVQVITPGSEDLQPPFDMVSVRETFNNVRGRRSNIMLEKLSNEREVDILSVGINGIRAFVENKNDILGSVTTDVIQNSSCNVMVAQANASDII